MKRINVRIALAKAIPENNLLFTVGNLSESKISLTTILFGDPTNYNFPLEIILLQENGKIEVVDRWEGLRRSFLSLDLIEIGKNQDFKVVTH